ncbi:phage holin family protein [Erythrobacter sp. W53]|uniref:phage holin family protein n=1 Tax=Erythrobacter sp. W53 TaxID=3425947 RepID=UPI003D7675FC
MREEDNVPERGEPAPGDMPEHEQDATDAVDPADAPVPPSLADDLKALTEDGKVYAEAELAFQKSRAAFTGNRAKHIAIYAIFALGFLHLALVALVVGSVFALAQVINPWLATGAVTLVLILGIVILGLMIRSKAKDIGFAFGKSSDEAGNTSSETDA